MEIVAKSSLACCSVDGVKAKRTVLVFALDVELRIAFCWCLCNNVYATIIVASCHCCEAELTEHPLYFTLKPMPVHETLC